MNKSMRFFLIGTLVITLAGIGGVILAQQEGGEAASAEVGELESPLQEELPEISPPQPDLLPILEKDSRDKETEHREETTPPPVDEHEEQEKRVDISFPISKLGNCGSEEECRAYCDDSAHQDACLAWAEGHGIKVEHTPLPEVPPEGGPGGCSSEEECRTYCDDPGNFGECIAYAEEHGRLTAEKAKELREKLAESKEDQKKGPGGCDSEQSCIAYCSDRSHTEECIEFAVGEGRMTAEQAARARNALRGDIDIPQIGKPKINVPKKIGPRVDVEPEIDVEKVQRLLETEKGPGECGSFSECEQYCNDPAHEDTCFSYAVEHGLLPQEEVDRINKLRDTEGPGGCRGRQCEAYCDEAGHEKECLEFAHNQGFIPAEEYNRMKKFVELEGPGGCRGRTCEKYCEDPAHRKECFAFAKENGIIAPEEVEKIERITSKLEAGGGPGGCTDETTCRQYCSDPSHFDECSAFAVDAGLMPPDQAERMLKQFIQTEHFGEEGFSGSGGAGGFGPPAGFDRENIPPEYRAEFEKRFKDFEQYKTQFEQGVPSGFEGEVQKQFQKEFQNKMPEGFDPTKIKLPSTGGSLRVFLKKDPFQGDFELFITAPGGIKSFSLSSVAGAPYSGGLDCPGTYTSSIRPRQDDFPIQVQVETCSGETLTSSISSPFGEPVAVPPANSQQSPPEFQGFGSTPPPAGFEDQFKQQYQQQYEEQFKQQYEEQYKQQFQQSVPEGYNSGASPFQIFLDLFGF